MTIINPGLIVGPSFGRRNHLSAVLMRRIMNRKLKATPKLSNPIVDVRDVAISHVKAI